MPSELDDPEEGGVWSIYHIGIAKGYGIIVYGSIYHIESTIRYGTYTIVGL